MRKVICAFVVFFILSISLNVKAEKEEKPELKIFGIQIDAAVPNGIGISFVNKPGISWAHLNLGITYNAMNVGFFSGITIDPIKSAVALTLTGEVGGSFAGRLIGVSDAPQISYLYFNAWPGLEFGNRDRWRLFFRFGVSKISGTIHDPEKWLNNTSNNIYFEKPSFSASLLPTGKIGVVIYF